MTEETVKFRNAPVRVPDEAQMFYTGKAVRPSTTFGFLCEHLVENPGIPVKDLIQYMQDNFKPPKSGKFDHSFCRAYVRGMVKEGYAHTDPDAPTAENLAEPEPPVREKAEKPLNEAGQQVVDLLMQNGSMTMTELTTETGKNKRSLNAVLRGLMTRSLVVTEDILSEDGKSVEDKRVSLVSAE